MEGTLTLDVRSDGRESGGSLSYPQPTMESGEHRKVSSAESGAGRRSRATAANDFGRFMRNFVRFYACFTAFWKLQAVSQSG